MRRSATTYALLQGQTNQIIEKRTRVLSPDVVLVSAVSEGTYTDKAGFTFPPVGLGSTAVFVRRGAAVASHSLPSIRCRIAAALPREVCMVCRVAVLAGLLAAGPAFAQVAAPKTAPPPKLTFAQIGLFIYPAKEQTAGSAEEGRGRLL